MSYNFGAASDKSIKELNDTVTENNRLTSEQNEKMLKYTRWLIALTIIIAVLTGVMVLDVIFRIGRFGFWERRAMEALPITVLSLIVVGIAAASGYIVGKIKQHKIKMPKDEQKQ